MAGGGKQHLRHSGAVVGVCGIFKVGMCAAGLYIRRGAGEGRERNFEHPRGSVPPSLRLKRVSGREGPVQKLNKRLQL